MESRLEREMECVGRQRENGSLWDGGFLGTGQLRLTLLKGLLG